MFLVYVNLMVQYAIFMSVCIAHNFEWKCIIIVTFSVVSGANEGEGADDECEARAGVVVDEEGGQDSRVAQCFMSVEQPVEGCFHYNMLGQNDK